MPLKATELFFKSWQGQLLLNLIYFCHWNFDDLPIELFFLHWNFIDLCCQLLLGQLVMVKPSEAEKNLVQSNAYGGAAGVTGPYGAVDQKLYVGNLHFNMTESQLWEVFYF